MSVRAFCEATLPAMHKRDKFIVELREEARRKWLPFRAEKWRGKGGHMMVFVGDRLTTVPSREIDPKTARKIRETTWLSRLRRNHRDEGLCLSSAVRTGRAARQHRY